MTSLTDLREVVDVVIGVDTHVHTHSAAVIDSATGGVLGEITVAATAAGYAELVEFANRYPLMRAWAIEGTGGHGAGLTRHLLELSELVVELDRPKRSARRHGAKSDPLDAIRAAREAMARPRLGTPRSGGERQALSVLLTARRSAINASTEARLQLFSLVVAAPEPAAHPVPWSEARRDAQHRRQAACPVSVGRRDDQHCRRAAHPGPSRARDAAASTRAAEGGTCRPRSSTSHTASPPSCTTPAPLPSTRSSAVPASRRGGPHPGRQAGPAGHRRGGTLAGRARLEAADQQPHVPLSYDTVSLDSTRAALLPFD
jgi:hypothetical protein